MSFGFWLKAVKELKKSLYTLNKPAIVAPEMPGVISAKPMKKPATNLYKTLDIRQFSL